MEEALIKRVMPHSIEAEQSVVGAMLMDKDAVIASIEALKEDDFYRDDNKLIYRSMLDLYNQGMPIDIITVKNDLRSKRNLRISRWFGVSKFINRASTYNC